MSLLKQLFLAICLFLVVAFTGSFIAGMESSREQLLSQLRSHAQDAATALGLSMTPHVDDPAMIELMVSSVFDSGYFANIRVVRTDCGVPANRPVDVDRLDRRGRRRGRRRRDGERSRRCQLRVRCNGPGIMNDQDDFATACCAADASAAAIRDAALCLQ